MKDASKASVTDERVNIILVIVGIVKDEIVDVDFSVAGVLRKKAHFDELIDIDSAGFRAGVPVVLFSDTRDCRSCLLLELCSRVVVV